MLLSVRSRHRTPALTMSFDSSNSVVICSPVEQVFGSLSSVDKFSHFMHLSPTCHSVDVLRTDQVALQVCNDVSDLALCDIATNRPSYHTLSAADQCDRSMICTRVHFQMVERVSILFGLIKKDVTIFGTQITNQTLRLHIYESDANKGLVRIYKLRRFTAKEGNKTLVEELICGKTTRLLKHYTQSSCRAAHQQHMQQYQSLIQ